jgi:mannosyltransferase OCH1-like enzyme
MNNLIDPFDIDNCHYQNNNIYFLYGFLGDGYTIKPNHLINLKKWENKHPNWNIIILRDNYDKLTEFVCKKFNWFYQTYINYQYPIQRCDTIRYMLLYYFGGIYSDLDVYPNKSSGKLLSKYPWANIIIGIARKKDTSKCKLTTQYESIRKGEPEIPIRLSNYLMLARIPNHPIWIDILNQAKDRAKSKIKSQYGIIYTTGPDVVTTAISKNRSKYNDIAIIPYNELTCFYNHQCDSINKSSWRKELPQGELNINTI